MRKIQTALASVLCLLFPLQQMSMLAAGQDGAGKPHPKTESPIKHVIVIIGENRTFDHIFGLYQPPSGQTVSNLLSNGILNSDGTPGPHFSLAAQYLATDTTAFSISPTRTGPYSVLPQPNTDGTPSASSDTSAPFLTLAEAKSFEFENGLPNSYYPFLTTGASGLPNRIPDPRFPSGQPNGPFQLTLTVPYDDYGPSAVHRFYQMWQQLDCNIAYATPNNPSGCNADLFPWVEDTVGAGTNGNPQPPNFNDQTTGEGDNAMGVYNNNVGDWPYFTALARTYTLSDNFHQSVMGGTGANHIMFGSGDDMWFSDGSGNPIVPPSNEIENPNPQPGTNNWYAQDGYSGGSLSNCADQTQPGVGAVLSYLNSLPYKVWKGGNCDAGHYYLLNNYNPGYFGDGTVNTSAFTLPPSNVRTIGDALLEAKISWKYYGEDWDLYVQDPNYANPKNNYCNICNPFQYVTSIMNNAAVRKAHLQDLSDFYSDVSNNALPAVSIIKPDGFLDGHPASSKGDLFEGFVRKIVTHVQANRRLWADTAILITFDEGGGYWDSGYVQPIDFFGDGTRIPLLVVSPFSTGGNVVHSYGDHVSILKFIERNWGLSPLTSRSRDNLPNPVASSANPYAPSNSPAIGDLFDTFNFKHRMTIRP